MSKQVYITECPRDAMQGIGAFIPTELKIRYLNALLRCGFSTLDFGSFVSPKAIPQLADTAEVLAGLEPSDTKLLAIIANLRGAEAAVSHSRISYLGYPFSVSETFQQRNTHHSISASLDLVREIQQLSAANGKELLVYLSMAFGNPYGDPWSVDIVQEWAAAIADLGIRHIALADTIGSSEPNGIRELFSPLLRDLPQVRFIAHFHSLPHQRKEKINAAWQAGCRSFDVALKGFGGCPFAKDELTGNIATESLLEFLDASEVSAGIHPDRLSEAMSLAAEVFAYH